MSGANMFMNKNEAAGAGPRPTRRRTRATFATHAWAFYSLTSTKDEIRNDLCPLHRARLKSMANFVDYIFSFIHAMSRRRFSFVHLTFLTFV